MKLGISLFSSGGIGDLAMRSVGVEMLVANELLEERASIFSYNYEKCEMIVGNIWEKKDIIIQKTLEKLDGRTLDVVFATPPCQGMSKNGRGKLLSKTEKRIHYDIRNLLIIPTIEIIKKLNPVFFVFENVPEMMSTDIHIQKEKITYKINIIKYIENELEGYNGSCHVVEFADYGIPERRKRLIGVFSRHKNKEFLIDNFLPQTTHSKYPNQNKLPWVTLRDVISNIPPLDAKNEELASDKNIELHKVPVLDEDKYLWVSNTPEGKSAFDNQCIQCGYSNNAIHTSCKNEIGVNRSSKDTPIYCSKCGALLPRPWVKENGNYRIMSAYTSSYKRMLWDLPSSTLTCNLSYACSDNKIHPSQNRVLSLYEATIIHTINLYKYFWKRKDGKKVSDKLIREIIGESIPPKGLEIIIKYVFSIVEQQKKINIRPIQLKLI